MRFYNIFLDLFLSKQRLFSFVDHHRRQSHAIYIHIPLLCVLLTNCVCSFDFRCYQVPKKVGRMCRTGREKKNENSPKQKYFASVNPAFGMAHQRRSAIGAMPCYNSYALGLEYTCAFAFVCVNKR